MDIYKLLKADHRKVEDLFETLVAARSDGRREQILMQIRDELLLHAKTEEATFYAALEEADDEMLSELMPEAEEEHDEVRQLLEEIEAARAGTPKWYILVGSLKHAVEHHVEEEEGMIFEHAKEVLSDAQARELAQQMQQLKQEETPDEERIHEAPRHAA
jgi:hemerythrin superfamily protein